MKEERHLKLFITPSELGSNIEVNILLKCKETI